MVQTVRRCLHSQSEKKHEKKTLSIVETPMQSKSVTKVKGKRKRNAKQVLLETILLGGGKMGRPASSLWVTFDD